MEEAILNELESIRLLLFMLLLVAVVTLIVLGMWVHKALNMAETQDGLDRRSQLFGQAKDLEDRGQYEELYDLCSGHLLEYPKDSLATFYKGLAQFKLGSLEAALRSMSEYRELDPTNVEHANEYIEAIQAQMEGPRST